jgi:hypothetical protein
MLTPSVRTRVSVALVTLWLIGCSCGTTPPTQSFGVGQPCTTIDDCRLGLICQAGVCAGSHAVMFGRACVLSVDCMDGTFCGASRTCEHAGMGMLGADCNGDADCVSGLVCAIEGFGGRCRMPGTRDLFSSCMGQSDCLAGLTCVGAPGHANCQSLHAVAPPVDGSNADAGVPPPTPPMLGSWAGAECTTDDGPSRAYFEVPRGSSSGGPDAGAHDAGVSEGGAPTTQAHDFFRLPFPNDVRRTATGIDLSGFPTPGTAAPVDVLGLYVASAQTDLDGFATNAVAYFRFSRSYDGCSVDPAGCCGGHMDMASCTADTRGECSWSGTPASCTGPGARIQFVDITPTSPDYAQGRSLGWETTSGPVSRYICNDWLAVRTAHGDPLRPGNTYAVIISNGIRDTSGTAFMRDADLNALLATTAPTDASLTAAYAAYAPLRTFLADATVPTAQRIDPTTILNVAMFTTQHAESMIPALRTAEHAAPVATITNATICASGTLSPCDDGTPERACPSTTDPAFTEIHGHLSLPIFQRGTAPYETPADGGDIAVDAMGHPMVVRTEQVCVSITVPTAAAPANGYPVLIAAHGTGGSFTDHIRAGIAHDLATATIPAVSIGIDLPEHGARRGGSTRSPDRLVYNFTNPHAARDVFLQGAADLMGTVRFAVEGSATVPGQTTPIALDATRIVLFGHSQGAQHAALMGGFEPSIAGLVLSEAGGDLSLSLLNKTLPFNIARAVPIALFDVAGDGTLVTGDFNPALSILQMYFERSDAVNVARRLMREVPTGQTGLSVLASYGVGDHYTPEPTLQAYQGAAGFTYVRPILTNPTESPTMPGFLPGLRADAPLMGNVMNGTSTFTVGARMYASPAGVDGHFALLQSTQGHTDLDAFVEAIFAGTVPPIGH